MIRHCVKLLMLIVSFLYTIGISFLFAQDADAESRIEELILKAEEMSKADPSKAIYYSNAAIIEAQRIGDQSHLAMALATLGESYMNQGDFDLGFETITNAIEHCSADSLQLKAYIFVRLSGCYLKLMDLERAFEYVNKAADIYQSVNDSAYLASCYNSRGLVYIQMPDNVKAEENFKAALEINRKLGAKKLVAANLNNLCLYEGNTPEKIAMLHEAIAINDSLGAVWSLGENYNNLGTQYFYAKEYQKALDALQTAMTYARKINAKELICDNYRYSFWVYEAQKNYPAAYENLLNLYETEQELLAKDAIRQIELNTIQKRLRAKEQEILVQEQAFQIKNLRMQQYIAFLIVGAVLLILLYIGFHYRHRRKVQLLEAARKLDEQEKELIELKLQQAEIETRAIEKELDYNRHELTNFAFFVRSRNDMLAHIQSMIKEGYKLTGSQTETHLRSINAYISQFNARNTETEVLIDQVNAQFIDKLSRLHPDLSKNEQRLASLLRIGLSTKEIASVIDSTPKTVNMARYRLRKHLNLETDDSLTEYMKSI
ncbi:tetratricopeptide (TPR) repeat protein [Parabacteroides sp. PF5-5]|uniref:tetratricopeptide repeat protein n=1 Tax=unclassified Parabacteroides TaxID=2649774 RepID=UPI002473F0A3|nr:MULTISPECIES: tetratricopeptide repeat protein [unclassified Parabacteroides]MDH6305388.1 tetratricopeptide (TPR) repeat protein [Parabacteroides sp. PH5-39]MDH6316098.1 tetratricopeptide (TPR) repeat protein [Parabacteroides sp. PF5-13]MDH6320248.1 tetratricopeptide (TPR) repeat protein [Parabacteroides sp. PH5-13]MDH6323978.1 tetratricopeptide (TPR) repeat protein [Parabacteroides sp. PH5-8]MDH6327289.1 tetratricopeptide (TPR) repeat protein [Parabacteroides sp. PH5-41]